MSRSAASGPNRRDCAGARATRSRASAMSVRIFEVVCSSSSPVQRGQRRAQLVEAVATNARRASSCWRRRPSSRPARGRDRRPRPEPVDWHDRAGSSCSTWIATRRSRRRRATSRPESPIPSNSQPQPGRRGFQKRPGDHVHDGLDLRDRFADDDRVLERYHHLRRRAGDAPMGRKIVVASTTRARAGAAFPHGAVTG